jgi:hypothetical protein
VGNGNLYDKYTEPVSVGFSGCPQAVTLDRSNIGLRGAHEVSGGGSFKEARFWTKSKQSVLNDKFGNNIKPFWFRFQNNIGTFVLSFFVFDITM